MSAERNAVSYAEDQVPAEPVVYDPESVPAETEAGDLLLSRLPGLHAEAIETSRLANQVGRAPAAAGLLAVAGAIVFGCAVGSTALLPLMIWSFFVTAAAVALLAISFRAARTPFDLPSLRGFASDMNAALLFAGFAWGAGAFLAVPASAGSIGMIVFGIGGVLATAATLKARAATFYFLVPGLGLPIIAASVGPQGLVTALVLGAIAAAAAILAHLLERETARRLGVAPLPFLTFS
jgi:hypothetical protein